MARPLIAIDGYNLALEQGTGVATYSRSLSRRLHAIGAEVGVLYGQRASIAKDPMLREVTFFDPRTPAQPGFRRLLNDVVHGFKVQVGIDAVSVPATTLTIRRALENRLPHFDQIWNVPDLYRASVNSTLITKTFGRVRLPTPPALMHWTYPLPLTMPGVRNIYTLHDLVPLRMPYATLDNKRRYLRTLRGIIRRGAHIVTVSETSKRDIVSLLGVPEEQVTNTYQAVDIPDSLARRPEEMVRKELEGGFGLGWGGYFLFFGAIEPKKNIARLIEAYLASGVQTPLVICGKLAWNTQRELGLLYEDSGREFPPGGPLEGVQTLTRRLRDRIILLDYVPFGMLVGLIRGARAVLFPSLYEGFGLPALEAMQLGTPVMTSSTSSLPEVCGDAALLVDPYDTRVMAEAIRTLDADPGLRADLAARGPRRAALFSPAAYDARLRELYVRLGVRFDGAG